MTRYALTFDEVTAANRRRCERWHPGFPVDQAWTGADWSNAVCGEAGEMANVVKKLRRIETGTAPGPDDPPVDRLREMLADEIADTFTYLDLLATFYGIDLPAAVARKFNRVSERQGFPDRLPVEDIDGGSCFESFADAAREGRLLAGFATVHPTPTRPAVPFTDPLPGGAA